MDPLGFAFSATEAEEAVARALRDMGGEIVTRESGRLHVLFRSRIFRFVDDVDVEIDEDERRVDFRSASRTGYSDLGVNRKRMRELTSRLVTSGAFFVRKENAPSR